MSKSKQVEEIEEVQVSGVSEDVEDMKALIAHKKAAREDADEAREKARAPRRAGTKKKGGRPWDGSRLSKLHHPDRFRIPGMKGGKHKSDPAGHYVFKRADKLQQLLMGDWSYASRKKLGMPVIEAITGVSQGVSPDQIWVDGLVLMRQPIEQHEDARELNALKIEAQMIDMEDAAESYAERTGNQQRRHGHFGKGELPLINQRRLEREAAEEEG